MTATTTTQGITRVLRTASVRDPLHAIGGGGRVFVQVGRAWWFAGFLIAPVELGERLRYVSDDMVTVSAVVVSIEEWDTTAA
ncbi:hypothetical protein DVS28_a0366 [Euzebya pacifica]|jgi:hypothetical protein|uniref:Uncharacterized protein n=1 Tax=Euzebya pacifica TaxID=1608957 RepID=A0A346XS76_9ACTN|nr:hypothetical protein [Euzebya pacifica]AXV05073.1 hypothetical protein DVS28_a0366 [Euzebya pacifica]